MIKINPEVLKVANECEEQLKNIFSDIDNAAYNNSLKVLNAFHKYKISENHFQETTGYGYADLGRDTIEQVFADVLGSEDALVRNQFISGSHALNVTFFALLRPGDTMLSISGEPYDTLHEVIGIKPNASSLKSFQINYAQIDLKDDDFNYSKITEYLKKNQVKLIHIQRSKGYSTRKSLTIDKVEKVIKLIRQINSEVIIMVDNCYCEFVEAKTPIEVGADVIVGSLIKNLGGSIAPNGAYVAGRKDLVELAAERLTTPGQGKEVGPTLGINKSILQGIYMAPSVVANSLKTAIFTSLLLEKLGYNVEPKYNDKRADIVQNIIFNDEDKLIKYTQGIQAASAIDAHTLPVGSPMPGYSDEVIMASGSFIQGSSIEISCDGPLRKPYIAYQQGAITYDYGKIAVLNAVSNIYNN